MERFIRKHTGKITGTIGCFDRILFKGYLPITWAQSMETFMANQGLLIKDFKGSVFHQSQRLNQHAQAMAQKAGRPYIHLNGPIRKEDRARQIAVCDGITQGLLCVLAAVEACTSFRLVPTQGRPWPATVILP